MTPEQEMNEEMVRSLAAPEVFARGRTYYHQGRVLELVKRGNELHAEVAGSAVEPYHVVITSEEGTVADYSCTCPYEWGACKHVVAVLLAYLEEPDEVEARPPLEEVLAPLDRDQLEALILELADADPELIPRIEMSAALRSHPPAAPGAPESAIRSLPPIDPAPIRREVRSILRSAPSGRRHDYGAAAGIVRQVESIIERARPYVDAGDGRSALAILEAVADEYAEGFQGLYDRNGETYEPWDRLGALLAEALLTTELTEEEREEWTERIEGWLDCLGDFGQGLEVALGAALHGWSDPVLQGVLRGEPRDDERWTDEEADWFDILAEVRLDILERQGRTEEFLRLAKAAGEAGRYATMLVRLGRVEEAVAYSLGSLQDRGEALALARALQEHGAGEEALRGAEHGLTLPPGVTVSPGLPAGAELPAWTRDLAASLGQSDRALQVGLAAMRENPTLAGYLAVQSLAGEQWPALREELLEELRRSKRYSSAKVDIFLHEGLHEDAMAAVDAFPGHELLGRVADAIAATHPDWVFRACTRQFDRIADAGQTQYYPEAAAWLAQARDALVAAGRQSEWRAYLDEVLKRHNRKHSLRPLIERLG